MKHHSETFADLAMGSAFREEMAETDTKVNIDGWDAEAIADITASYLQLGPGEQQRVSDELDHLLADLERGEAISEAIRKRAAREIESFKVEAQASPSRRLASPVAWAVLLLAVAFLTQAGTVGAVSPDRGAPRVLSPRAGEIKANLQAENADARAAKALLEGGDPGFLAHLEAGLLEASSPPARPGGKRRITSSALKQVTTDLKGALRRRERTTARMSRAPRRQMACIAPRNRERRPRCAARRSSRSSARSGDSGEGEPGEARHHSSKSLHPTRRGNR